MRFFLGFYLFSFSFVFSQQSHDIIYVDFEQIKNKDLISNQVSDVVSNLNGDLIFYSSDQNYIGNLTLSPYIHIFSQYMSHHYSRLLNHN